MKYGQWPCEMFAKAVRLGANEDGTLCLMKSLSLMKSALYTPNEVATLIVDDYGMAGG